jgi:CRISPR-associated protein Cmr4
MQTRLFFTHALSPLHAGTGQGVGVIDLPIAREKATGIPYLPGSSIKGTLREASASRHTEKDEQHLLVFGPDTTNAADHAGSVQISDQRLLLLPVRSLRGTFAWVTSPYLLRRFARDAQEAVLPQALKLPQSIPAIEEEKCLVPDSPASVLVDGAQVILEDLDPQVRKDAVASQWATFLANALFATDKGWHDMLQQRVCIVSDNMLKFLLNTATEVIARIKLQDDTKTVQQGGLWYEEALPTESILAGVVVSSPVSNTNRKNLRDDQVIDHISTLTNKTLQFGGKATVGRGICRLVLL